MILALVDDVNDYNYRKIIDFIQIKKYDVNNELLDKLMVEKDINKHTQLLNEFKNNIKKLLNIFIDKCKETLNYNCVCKN